MMTYLLLLMTVGVLAGIPAALLVLATDPRNAGDDAGDDGGDDDAFAAYWRSNQTDRRAAQLLRMDLTQEQLYAYMVGEVTR